MKKFDNILDKIEIKKFDDLTNIEFIDLKTKVFKQINHNKSISLKYLYWSVSTVAVFLLIILIQKVTIDEKLDFSDLDKQEIRNYLLEQDDDRIFDEIEIKNNLNENIDVLEFVENEDIEEFYINN